MLHDNDDEEALLIPKNSPESPAVGDAIGATIFENFEIEVSE